MSAHPWHGRHRLQQLAGRAEPERHVPEVVVCERCHTVVAFGCDALGRTTERCACGERAVARRPPPALEDGRRQPRRAR